MDIVLDFDVFFIGLVDGGVGLMNLLLDGIELLGLLLIDREEFSKLVLVEVKFMSSFA